MKAKYTVDKSCFSLMKGAVSQSIIRQIIVSYDEKKNMLLLSDIEKIQLYHGDK